MIILEVFSSLNDSMNLARTCRDAVRKAEYQLELKLAKDVENNKKAFFRYVSGSTGKTYVGTLLNRAGKQVTNNASEAVVLNTFFAFVFTSIARPQITGSSKL